ncbi:MAG TPA: glycosyltransferase family 2 protein [Armatimonadota bacterium]|jgi:glycosyltransferase involved in cell wall biosynthesis
MVNSLSIVFPMYNEIGNIETSVRESLRVALTITPDVEIIVVDDASTDGCGALADRLAEEIPQLRVLHHERNRKLGGSLRTGFAAATKEWIFYTDSDLPIVMDDMLGAIPLTDSAELIIGWRRDRAESKRREINSKIYNRMIRMLFGLRVKDVNFAFKFFLRSLYEQTSVRSEGSFIDAELILELRRVGARIAEMGLDYHPRVAGVSTLGSLRVVPRIFADMAGYRLRRHAPLTPHAGR